MMVAPAIIERPLESESDSLPDLQVRSLPG
ncbi:hypothetical protein BC793_110295 [Actinoplanes xinjiangensis]|uniref:Uncharacterized protein n=1 Tax=Actinoplanes xinjiangensis TaxID=512350 RepID=A0A316FBN9_9ACTN|nr:hypothetical protein BC793_110295 [Actinoplanes xinjiangensis]